jgi:inosine-uridine nucleoside N-ribohydrolase
MVEHKDETFYGKLNIVEKKENKPQRLVVKKVETEKFWKLMIDALLKAN